MMLNVILSLAVLLVNLKKMGCADEEADVSQKYMKLVQSADQDDGDEDDRIKIKIEGMKKPTVDLKDSGDMDSNALLESIYKLLKDQKHHEKDKEQEVADTAADQDDISARGVTSPCGEDQPLVIKDESGAIMSPGFFNGQYEDDVKCSWKFISPVGKAIKLKFQIMDIEQSNECSYDSVQVWDVRKGKGFRLAKYCGRSLPMELLQSTGRYMFVYFLTDESGGTGRFSFQWDFVDPMPSEPVDTSCGITAIKPSLIPRIVNGQEANPHSWPWQISVRRVINSKQYHVCGASIISKTVILTAAHCLFDKYHKRIPDSNMKVVAGDHDQTTKRDGPTQTPPISKIVVHRYYNSFSASSPYDIAAIILSSPLVMNKHVGTICLPREDPRIDDVCVATGWGDTKGTGDESVLNQVQLPLVSQTVCRQGDHYGSQIVDTVLCAGYEEGGKDACQGDSGGPFVCLNPMNGRWYLQGITSWGAGCGRSRKPGIYTRIVAYLNWIYKNTNVIS